MSMEDVVKLSTWMRRLSSLSWCLCMVEHCHADGGHYRLAWFSAFRLSFFLCDREFTRQTLFQWWGSENCSDEVVQRTVNSILWGRYICFHSKREMVTMLRSRDVNLRRPASFWITIHVPMLVIISVLKKKALFLDSPSYLWITCYTIANLLY